MPYVPRPPRGTAGPSSQADQAQAPVTARDAYISHRLQSLVASRNTGPGMVKNALHDTDAGGGLHAGSTFDQPQRVGGYSQMAPMSPQEAHGFADQFGKEFDGLSPQDQAGWHPSNAGVDPRETVKADGTRVLNLGSGSGQGSATPGQPANGVGQSASSYFAGPEGGYSGYPAAPPAQVISGQPSDVGRALRDSVQIENNLPPRTQTGDVPPLSESTLLASQRGRMTPEQQQELSRSAQADASAAYNRMHPGPPDTQHGGYGKIGQVDSPDAPQDTVSTDAQGNRSILTAGGGTVSIPASQPQDAPASGGSGIVSNGVPQTRDANGSFVASFTPPGSSSGLAQATAAPATLDNESQKKIVAQYPEIGNAGSWANQSFIGALHPGANSMDDAQSALAYLSKPPQQPTPAPAIAQAPTLPSPSFAPVTTRPNNDLESFPPSTATANLPDAPQLSLATGAPAAPQPGVGNRGFDSSLASGFQTPALTSSVDGATITADQIRAPQPAADSAQTAAIARNNALGSTSSTPASQAAPSGRGWLSSLQDMLPKDSQPRYDTTTMPHVGFNSGQSIVSPAGPGTPGTPTPTPTGAAKALASAPSAANALNGATGAATALSNAPSAADKLSGATGSASAVTNLEPGSAQAYFGKQQGSFVPGSNPPPAAPPSAPSGTRNTPALGPKSAANMGAALPDDEEEGSAQAYFGKQQNGFSMAS